MSMYWEKISTDKKEGFDIIYSVHYEDTPLGDLFDDEEEIKELSRKINRGDLQYFIARIEAFKHGIPLGKAYLGGMIYERYEDFIGDFCFDDLVWEATEEAKANIKKLVEEQ